MHSNLRIHSDLNSFCSLLHHELNNASPSALDDFVNQASLWRSWLKTQVKKFDPVSEALPKVANFLNPYRAIRSLTNLLPEGQISVTSDGTACVVGFQSAVIKQHQRLFHNSGCASMGYELPASIGAHYASGQHIVCLAGDGSIMMNLQELAYIGSMSLPITIFLLNNSGYHSIRQTQNNYFPGSAIGCGDDSGLPFPNFEKVSLAFGLSYFCTSDESLMLEDFKHTLSLKGPVIHELVLTHDQQFAPKVASRKLEDGTMVSNGLDDMAPFLPTDILSAIKEEALSL